MGHSKAEYFAQLDLTTEREREEECPTAAPGDLPAPVAYATGKQKQSIIQELAKRNHRRLTTVVLLIINRLTVAEADELLDGGLDAKQDAYDAADAAAL